MSTSTPPPPPSSSSSSSISNSILSDTITDDKLSKAFPYTRSEKCLIALTVFIALYEITVWLIVGAPLTSHSRHKTPLAFLCASAAMNSAPHLLCGSLGVLKLKKSYVKSGVLLYKQQKELQKAASHAADADEKHKLREKHAQDLQTLRSEHQHGGLRFCLYILYLTLLTCMQLYTWWLPYCCGIITPSRLTRMQTSTQGIVSILPASSTHLVPTLEYTILLPLCVLSLVLSVHIFLQYRPLILIQVHHRKRVNYALLMSFSALLCYVPVSMAMVQSAAVRAMATAAEMEQTDTGAMIIAACMLVANMMFYTCFFWTPDYIKEVRQKIDEARSKKES